MTRDEFHQHVDRVIDDIGEERLPQLHLEIACVDCGMNAENIIHAGGLRTSWTTKMGPHQYKP
ncbi:MAG: hypothetical protein ACYDCJ_12470 [Gammaproteobacteria bacterium]